jgi:tetratricopeptide (TPR) repeat protein
MVSHPRLTAAVLLLLSAPALADTSESLMTRSRVAEKLGKADAAERLAQSAIVANPLRASSYVGLADLYLREGRMDFAGFYYAEALEIEPENREAQRGLAQVDSAKKQETAAAEGTDAKKVEH